MKIRAKRITVAVLSLILGINFIILASASAGGMSWYCVHVKDHKQPKADSSLSFIEEHGGYYVDGKHGDENREKVIYLTFDAGYENGNIEKILDCLRDNEVRGAFFVLGNLIEKNGDLIKRMNNEGHLVCNHTFSHKIMVGKSRESFEAELLKLESFCFEKTGVKMAKYYRPPEGRFDAQSLDFARDMGYKTVFWSFGYADWDNQKQPSHDWAKKKILDNLHNGEVMLLHPTSRTNAEILGELITEIKAQGYRFGTLDELCT